MFGWFRKVLARVQPKTGLYPESRWHVGLDEETIGITDGDGGSRSLALRDLSGVVIETNDSGPWGADLWWLFFGVDDRLACAFPQGATGEQALIDHLMGLPGFDHGAMIQAMGSTENAVFPVWRKPG